MKQFLLTLLILYSKTVLSAENSRPVFRYTIPTGFHSLEKLNPTAFEETKKGYLKGNMVLIANLSVVDKETKQLAMNISTAEEIKMEYSDDEYLQKIADKFKMHKLGEYSTYDWMSFKRLDATEPKISYFIKTQENRRLVVVANYTSEKFPEIIENTIKKIALENPDKNENSNSVKKSPLILH